MTRLALLCLLLTVAAPLNGEELTSTTPEFTATIPESFTAIPGSGGAVLGAYIDESKQIPTILIYERYGHEIMAGADKNDEVTVLGADVVESFTVSWGWTDVNCAILQDYVVEGTNSYTQFTCIAWVPTKGEATMVKVIGNSMESAQLKTTLRAAVDGIDGPAARSYPVEIWYVVGPMLLVFLAGGIFMFMRSRRPKKRTTAFEVPPPVQPQTPQQQAQAPEPKQPRSTNNAAIPPWEQ